MIEAVIRFLLEVVAEGIWQGVRHCIISRALWTWLPIAAWLLVFGTAGVWLWHRNDGNPWVLAVFVVIALLPAAAKLVHLARTPARRVRMPARRKRRRT